MSKIHGLMAEFIEAEDLVKAARLAREAGYRRIDAYTPFPIEELPKILGTKDHVATIALVGGLVGAAIGFLMQWYANVVDYPINIAGRPYDSWPAFIPVTFELTVLFASLSAAFGMLWLNGLPKPFHPAFDAADFDRASSDRFFLCIEARDPGFDPEKTKCFLQALDPLQVVEVPDES